jgi:hypothetical protein
MAVKLVKCRHCGFEFQTDVAALIYEGEITAVRALTGKSKTRKLKTIDLFCPECKRYFKQMV